MELVFATHNAHKLKELQEILGNSIKLKSLTDLGVFDEIEENGTTIEENASLKAKYVFDRFGINVFADDTGLEIEALNGEPGVISARYAGEEKNPLKNMEKVLRLMQDKENRSARFRTVISLILNGKEHLFEGIVSGQILKNPIGDNGFGYDPVFMPGGYALSFAQMDSETKNNISHRGKAVEKLIDFLNKSNI